MGERIRDTCFASGETTSTSNKWSKLSFDFMNDGPSECAGNNSSETVTDTVDSSRVMKEMNWKTWEHRGDVEEDEDDDEEFPFHLKFTEEISSSDDEPENEENASRFGCEAMPPLRSRKHLHDNTEINKTTSRNLDNVDNLIKKFSIIETLRRREKMKKIKENVLPHRKPCSTHSPSEIEKPAMNPEVFLGSKMHSKKRRDEWERRKSLDDESNKGPFLKDEDDKDIDEMVKMLLTSSISAESNKTFTTVKKESDSCNSSSHKTKEKENHHYDDCCQTLQDYSASGSSGNSSESETQESSFVNHLSDDLNWETDISGDVDAIFDGYNIDHLSSFHDWMIDDVLSRPLNSSYNIKSSVCEICGSYVDNDHVCNPQSEHLDASTKKIK